jgi:hypothetical protein
MAEKNIIEAEFIILDDRGAQNTLECPRCGNEFDIDAMTELNLVWNWKQMAFVAKCPLCGTQQQ